MLVDSPRIVSEGSVSDQFQMRPEGYAEAVRAAIPRFDELQAAAIEAIPLEPGVVLDLGVGTGETSRRLLEAYPGAEITGLDSSPEMLFGARDLGIEVRLARMEDPLPDGPWDLVIAVLSVHHFNADQKRDLLRRVRGQSRALVLGDVVRTDPQITALKEGVDLVEDAYELASWCDGKVVWRADDLAVIAATYD